MAVLLPGQLTNENSGPGGSDGPRYPARSRLATVQRPWGLTCPEPASLDYSAEGIGRSAHRCRRTSRLIAICTRGRQVATKLENSAARELAGLLAGRKVLDLTALLSPEY